MAWDKIMSIVEKRIAKKPLIASDKIDYKVAFFCTINKRILNQSPKY